jgi:hypothetical protein
VHGRPLLQALILDTGALIALESRDRRAAGYIQRAREIGAPIFIPAGVVAQAWRNGSRQARLAALLGSPDVTVDPLDSERARATGEFCGRRRASDVVDASVVLAAREHRGFVVTSDPDDLARLDSELDLVAL